jgi:hypothetical protein
MIRTLIYFVVSFAVVVLFHVVVDGTQTTNESLSNAFFYVGITMFFGGVLTVTNVARVFTGATFIARSLSKEFRERYKTYNDYHQTKHSEESKGVYGGKVLIIGLIYIGISVFFAIKFFEMY